MSKGQGHAERRRRGLWLPHLLYVMASACAADPKHPAARFHLEGSLTQVMDLGYDEARVIISPDDIALKFVRIKTLGDPGTSDAGDVMAGTSEDYPFQLAYLTLGEPLPSGAGVDLAGLDPQGHQRGVMSRNVSNDPRNTFPKLVRGGLTFDRPLEAGEQIHGDFHVTFENGIDVASGRTAFVSFTAKVQP